MSVVINGSAGVTTNSGAVYNGIASGTAVASTSGTSIDFTSIPSWVKRITVMFNGVSTNGTSNYLVQIGSGSVTTSGYVGVSGRQGSSSTAETTSTAGFQIAVASAALSLYSTLTINNISGNIWVSSHCGGYSNGPGTVLGGGNVTLSGVIDRVRITTVNGTDTFDAGSINIFYE